MKKQDNVSSKYETDIANKNLTNSSGSNIQHEENEISL